MERTSSSEKPYSLRSMTHLQVCLAAVATIAPTRSSAERPNMERQQGTPMEEATAGAAVTEGLPQGQMGRIAAAEATVALSGLCLVFSFIPVC